MRKFWGYLGIFAVVVIILAYLSFLFVLPRAVDLNQFKPELQKIAKEQANLRINFENPKIVTTPLLGAGIKADDISVKLPDNSILFSADNLKVRLSLPHLLLLTVKVSCFEVDNPFVNLEIVNDENFKVVKLVEDILNKGKEESLEKVKPPVQTENEGFKFNPEWIKIKVPCVKLKNYKILVNDLKSKHYLDLHGDELILGYFNGKSAKIKTYAELFSDENKNISANIDINTFLPTVEPSLDEEDDPAERIDIPFVNPVTMYRNYDLKANIDTKLFVRNHNDRIISFGYANIDGVRLKVGHLTIPESYFRAETFGTNVYLDTNIFPAKDQNIKLLGQLNYGKHPQIDMSLKSSDIKFNDLIVLTKAFLDSLHIYNELGQIKAYGGFLADCNIKTNFKNLKSNGFIQIKNGGLKVRNLGNVLSETNINLNFDDNSLEIKNSRLLIGNNQVSIDGQIDKKSVADICVKVNKVALPILFNAFAPQNLRDAYNFKSGNISFDLNIGGKLKKIILDAKFALENLNISDSNIAVSNKNLLGNVTFRDGEITGNVDNNTLLLSLLLTNSKISIPNFNLKIAENNINIQKNEIFFNDKSKLYYNADIIDYNKIESMNFMLFGCLNSDDIIKLIGQEFRPYFHSQGTIPIKVSFSGNSRKQTLFAHLLADKFNFITPVDLTNLAGKNTSLQAVVDFKPNRIKIKKTGLFTRTVKYDENGNSTVSLKEILGVDGTIEGNRINLLKVTMPQTLKGKIFAFPTSNFEFFGRLFVLGEMSKPRCRGGFSISNLSVPELLTTLEEATIKLKGHEADFGVENLVLNGSDIQVQGAMSLLPANVLEISNLDLSSRFMNIDKMMTVSERTMAYVPKQAQNQATAPSSENADIPVALRNGSINFARIMSGNIDVHNTSGRISLLQNIFYLNNLRTNVFKGQVGGDISMNLISTLMNIRVNGRGIDVNQALLDGANMKDTLSGTASFNTDISLQGATYEEQMKSLKGNVDFTVTNGQFGPFGKLENLIIAENIRESQFFQTALGGVISGLTTIDTTHFSDLRGKLNFEDGVCHIEKISSLGNILSLNIFGDFDLLKNTADMKVRARMASLVSNLLGPIGAINPANLINSAASLNVVTAKAFSLFCEMVPESEMNDLPNFTNKYVDTAATKFQLVVRGDVSKPLTLIKSFKWLATENEFNTAVSFVNSLPEPIEGSEAETIEQAVQEYEALETEKKTLIYKIKHVFKKDKK